MLLQIYLCLTVDMYICLYGCVAAGVYVYLSALAGMSVALVGVFTQIR